MDNLRGSSLYALSGRAPALNPYLPMLQIWALGVRPVGLRDGIFVLSEVPR